MRIRAHIDNTRECTDGTYAVACAAYERAQRAGLRAELLVPRGPWGEVVIARETAPARAEALGMFQRGTPQQ